MRKRIFSSVLVGALVLSACRDEPGAGTQSSSEPPSTPALNRREAMRLNVGNHTIQFFVAPDGPVGISETGPIGTPRILEDSLIGSKKPSEIYAMLAEGGAVVPKALVDAENRGSASMLQYPVVPPPQASVKMGGGPTFYKHGEQSWFRSNFCQSGWECVQGWNWANSSYGQHAVGYATYGMNCSESTCARTFNEDWWNGSSWQNLVSTSVAPGYYNYTWGGNTGSPRSPIPSYYFKSEILDCGAEAQVSLSDFLYQTDWHQCPNRKPCIVCEYASRCNTNLGTPLPVGCFFCGTY